MIVHVEPGKRGGVVTGPGRHSSRDAAGDTLRRRAAHARWLPPAIALAAHLLLLGGCVSLPTDYAKQPSRALDDTADTRLGRALAPPTAAHPGKSGFFPLNRGIDAFAARAALAGMAERSLDLQYYIWHGDLTGRLLAHHVLLAADRGVRVRLLIDDIGSAPDDMGLLLLDHHANVEVRLFNPIATRSMRTVGLLAEPFRVNRRMHNKSFTADNQAAIVGGRNIGDEYFEAGADVDFGDFDVLAVGPVVREVSNAFDLYWNSDAVFPITALTTARVSDEQLAAAREALSDEVSFEDTLQYREQVQRAELSRLIEARALELYWGRARALFDDPTKIADGDGPASATLLPQLAPIAQATRRELIVVSPYFIPGDEGVEFFARLIERGVDVTVLTNSLAATDVSAVHAGYSNYREALLEAGVTLYELKPTAKRLDADSAEPVGSGIGGSSRASLHAKTFVFDRRAIFVGSLNLDPRSVEVNTEIGIVFESPELASAFAERLLQVIDDEAYRLRLEPSPEGTGGGTTGRGLVWIGRENGEEIRYYADPQTNAWQRFKVWFLSLLPIESQL